MSLLAARRGSIARIGTGGGGGGGGAYEDEVTADSPVGYWKLGESSGSTLADSSGNGNDLTIVGSPTLGVAGIPGSSETAVDFTSSGHYAQTADPLPAVLQLSTPWTLEGWLYAHSTSLGNKGGVLTGEYDGANVRYMLGGWGDGGRFSTGFYVGGWRRVHDPDLLTSGAWHHFVGTWNGSTMELWRNGTKVVTAARSGSTSGTKRMRIAAGWDATSALNARLAHIAVYSSVLSDARIGAHYTAGSTA